MCATRAVLVFLFAIVACAVAIPVALPQPSSQIGESVGLDQHGALEKRQIGGLETGAGSEQSQDLKGSSSYGYGFYGGYGYYPYRPYWGNGWGYPYYGYGYGYPSYYYRPYRHYGYGGYGYGGFW